MGSADNVQPIRPKTPYLCASGHALDEEGWCSLCDKNAWLDDDASAKRGVVPNDDGLIERGPEG